MHPPWGLWLLLLVTIPALIALDLFVVPRGGLEGRLRPAVVWTIVWFAFGLAFAAVVASSAGEKYAIKYTTGFVVEKGLEVDQIALIVLVLQTFRVPVAAVQRLVFLALSVGLLLRLPFIGFGYYLSGLDRLYIHLLLAAFFVAGGVFLVRNRHSQPNPLRNPILGWLAKRVPFVEEYVGSRLTVRRDGARFFTLGAAVLVVLLTADLYFAATVPLAFAFEKPPFLVVASSGFAMLGFRSLYLVLEHLRIDEARLKVSIAVVLWVVALDLAAASPLHQPRWILPITLAVVLAVPVVGAVHARRNEATADRLD